MRKFFKKRIDTCRCGLDLFFFFYDDIYSIFCVVCIFLWVLFLFFIVLLRMLEM